jgi:hypothetical protein
VPGASSPFIDTWAPPQYVYGGSGGAGPVRSPDTLAGAILGSGGGDVVNSGDQTTYDATLTYKLAGTIILALVVIFVLQGSGFRFVGAAQVGFGR